MSSSFFTICKENIIYELATIMKHLINETPYRPLGGSDSLGSLMKLTTMSLFITSLLLVPPLAAVPGTGPTHRGSSGSSLSITSLALIDPVTSQSITALSDGSVIDLSKVDSAHLSIRATDTSISNTSSVVFQWDPSTPLAYSHTEHLTPYDLCSDAPNNPNQPLSCPQSLFSVGPHVLTVTPYDTSNSQGTPVSIHLTIQSTNSNSLSITSLALIDPVTSQSITALSDGSVIDLSKVDSAHLSIRATDTSISNTSSVVFQWDPSTPLAYSHTEHLTPYDLCSDAPNNPNQPLSCPQSLFSVGPHVLTVTPYDTSNSQGTPVSIHLTIQSSSGVLHHYMYMAVAPSVQSPSIPY